MSGLLLFIFAVNVSLLFVHEMDAIRHHEWKMFIVLKDMEDDKAYRCFLLLHVPLYVLLLCLLFSPCISAAVYAVDAFLIFHAVLHFCFKKHKNNRLTGTVSKTVIYSAGVISLIHISLMFLNTAKYITL